MFQPLRSCEQVDVGLERMFDAVGRYFQSGRKVCLVGVFALGHERDRFAQRVHGYFDDWVSALAAALQRAGKDQAGAQALAVDVVGGIQGALVMARAADKPELFMQTLARLRERLV